MLQKPLNSVQRMRQIWLQLQVHKTNQGIHEKKWQAAVMKDAALGSEVINKSRATSENLTSEQRSRLQQSAFTKHKV